MSGNHKVISFVPAFVSLLLAVGTSTVFRACAMKDDGTWMHCHSAQTAAAAGAIAVCVLYLLAALVRQKAVRIICGAAGVAGSILIFFIPGTIISMCMMNTMRCYTLMQPFVRIMAVLAAVFGAVNLAGEVRR